MDPLLKLVAEDYSRTRDHHEFGGGYRLRHSEQGFGVAWRSLDPHRHGACVVRVGGLEQRPDALQLAAFAPGQPVQLRPEPDSPEGSDTVAVWDGAGAVRLGHVARQNLFDARALLFGGDPVQAIVLWDWRTEAGTRTGLDVLIAREGVVAGLDAPARRYGRPPPRRPVATAPAAVAAAVVWLVLTGLFGIVGFVVGGVIALLAVMGTLGRR